MALIRPLNTKSNMITLTLLLTIILNVSQTKKPDSDIHESLIPSGYDKHQAPSKEVGNEYTNVVCGISAITIIRLSPKEMDMKIEKAFYIGWKDERLNTSVFTTSKNSFTLLSQTVADKLWYPLLSFANCKQCTSSTLYKPSKATLFFNHKRNEFYSWIRRAETFVCHFNMENYPFDKQTCSIKIQALRTQLLNINYTVWQPNLKLINVPPELELFNISVSGCRYDKDTFSSCGSFDISIQRLSGRPILLIFFPSILIVFMSWISFWLDPQTAAPRVALGLTSMLTLSTHFSAAQRDLPAVSTTMALDLWIFFCVLIVFASLIEFAFVSVLVQNSTSVIEPSNSTPNSAKVKRRDVKTNRNICKINANGIDGLSRFLFPLVFIVFNLYFWLNYFV